MILRPDGSEWREISDESARTDALAMGERAGHALRAITPADFLSADVQHG